MGLISTSSELDDGLVGKQGSDRATPTFEGKWTRLRPVAPADVPWLHELSMRADTGYRWKFGGETPSPPAFTAALWDKVMVQFIAEDRAESQPIGLVSAIMPDNRNGHARLAIVFDSKYRNQGWPLEACALFINYLFMLFPFRKLYVEGSDFNVDQYASGLKHLFVEEGRLRQHVFFDGAWVDVLILAVYRETWNARAAPLLSRLL